MDVKPKYDLVDVDAGTVSREVFISNEVYHDELERIFTRAWLFVGHEDQIPNPGDFVTSRMGEESVIVCRDRKGVVHVFLNTCRHRGMKVCRYDQGNTPVFTCPYHAWSYSLTGELVGVPGYQMYYEGILNRAEWGLVEVPHMGLYKGTIWATWHEGAVPLLDYLGGIREHLDDVLDGRDGSEGNSQMLGGVQKWTIPSNWKFGVENFIGDTYHGNPTHRSVQLIGIGPGGRSGQNGRRAMDTANLDYYFKQFPQGHGTWGFYQGADANAKVQFADSPATEPARVASSPTFPTIPNSRARFSCGTPTARRRPRSGRCTSSTARHPRRSRISRAFLPALCRTGRDDRTRRHALPVQLSTLAGPRSRTPRFPEPILSGQRRKSTQLLPRMERLYE